MPLLTANDLNFDDIITKLDTVLIYVSATWCAPCKQMVPIIERLAQTHHVAKLDVADGPNTVALYNLKSVPSFLLFREGICDVILTGTQTYSALVDTINLTEFR